MSDRRATRQRHITLPAGFVAAGVKAGIKTSGREDVAIVAGTRPVSAAVMTTTNQVVGAPVTWCRRALPRGYGRIRGIVVNSGCSNVCTGRRGWQDAADMAAAVATGLDALPREVLVASTGVIGRHLPMDKIHAGIVQALAALSRGNDPAVLRAIMTTDTREKFAVRRIRLGGKGVTVAGIIKGAGMIAPALATMICLVTTDAEVAPPLLARAWRAAVAGTVNAVTIDSDESTSDTALVMASGVSGAKVSGGSAGYRRFAAALTAVCRDLAIAMARDGEGATKLIEIRVTGAATPSDAHVAAKSVANSPLFKCAVHGGDPNWGRILCALGKSAARVDPDRATVKIGGVTVFARGRPKAAGLPTVQAHLRGQTVLVEADLGLGTAAFTAWTCDLSRQYITINADYHT